MNTTSWEDQQEDMGKKSSETYKSNRSRELFNKYFSNWFVWDAKKNKFEDFSMTLQRHHYGGYFTRVPEDALIFKTCKVN